MVGLTVKGMSLSGTLICNSEMGITVMDLFNDILTNISDIQNFLTQYNVTPLTNKPGMIIQGFHMFYRETTDSTIVESLERGAKITNFTIVESLI